MIDLGLVAALVPSLGAVGAVVGNSAGQFASLGSSIWILHRYLGLRVRPAVRALMPFVAIMVAVAAASIGGLLAQHDGVPTPIALGGAIVFAAMAGLSAVRACGGLIIATDLDAVRTGLPRGGKALGSAARLLRLDDGRPRSQRSRRNG